MENMRQETEKEIKLNQEFDLHISEQSILHSKELKIEFLAVLEDSRCPEGADCLWEGNAKVRIRAEKNDGKFKIFELNTNLEPIKINFEDYEIRMITLAPIPKSNTEIKTENYTATFLIKNEILKAK